MLGSFSTYLSHFLKLQWIVIVSSKFSFDFVFCQELENDFRLRVPQEVAVRCHLGLYFGLQQFSFKINFRWANDFITKWFYQIAKQNCLILSGGTRLLLLVVVWLVTKSWPALCDPMDCNSPVSCVHGISWARILEWVAISFSRESSQPRDETQVFCTGRQILYHWATWDTVATCKSKNLSNLKQQRFISCSWSY